MDAQSFCGLARRLMVHPAAPYHEQAVRAEVEKICAEQGLEFEQDKFGNVIARLRTARLPRPLVLAAHLDHPGFEILRPLSNGSWLARFRGGVPDHYFKPGVPIRLMPSAVPAKLGRSKPQKRSFEVLAARGSRSFGGNSKPNLDSNPRFAVWELEDFGVRQGQIHGRACDDLIGATAVLATMLELKRNRARVDVIGVLSRAEEIGFQGALALSAGNTLPSNSLVISLETSRELPGAKMGRGVILRVGDRTSIFDSESTRFLSEVAGELKSKKEGFDFQRALMSGGTCEATAYQEFGYQSAAVCIALGNYHNCGERNKIMAEFVNVADACSMVDLLVAVAKRMTDYSTLVGRLKQRLDTLLREARKNLRARIR